MRRALVDRLRRVRLDGVPAPYRAGVVACWALAAVLAVVVLVPGLTTGIDAQRAAETGLVARFDAPLGIRVLLPAAWSDLGRVVLVVGVVLAVLVLLPEPPRDPDRRALGVLTAAGGQLLALAVFLLAVPSLVGEDSLVVLGLFWLAVAVIAALVVRTRGERPV